MVETGAGQPGKDDRGDFKEVAGKAAVAAALATTLVASSPPPDQVQLPDVVPLVQTVDTGGGIDLPDAPADDADQDKAPSWKSALKILKFIVLAMALVAALAFFVLGGFASCVGQLAAPAPASSSSSEAVAEQA